jgi:hypothetical protein
MNVCAYCDKDFNPTQYHHQQQCCSRQCGQLYRQAKERVTDSYQPARPAARRFRQRIPTGQARTGAVAPAGV